MAINLLYTTLEDHGAAADHAAWVQIHSAWISQRVVRRFQTTEPLARPPAPTAPVQAVAATRPTIQQTALPASAAPAP